MVNKPTSPKAIDILRRRFPELSEEELLEADESFGRYLELTLHLYKAIRSDPERYKKFEEAMARKALESYNQPIHPQ